MKIVFKIFTLLGVNLLILECLCIALVNSGLINTSFPTYELQNRRFFGDYNKDFGVWHLPNSSFRHKTMCFDATYQFNSSGAKDTEFGKKTSQKNIFLIGDSMAEGFGLSNSDSLDSQLESISGANILNLGTSGHFGTTQYSILYDSFQEKFKHDQLIIMLTLENDFLDDSFDFGEKVFHQRYRPYRIADANKQGVYSLIYFDTKFLETGELVLKDILAAYLASYHVAKFVYKAGKAHIYKETNKISKTNVIDDEVPFKASMDLMVHNLNLITKKASQAGVEVFIVLAPSSSDVSSGIQKPQTKKIKKELLNRVTSAEIIDPFINFKNHRSPESLFHSCDNHLSAEGTKELAKHLSNFLS